MMGFGDWLKFATAVAAGIVIADYVTSGIENAKDEDNVRAAREFEKGYKAGYKEAERTATWNRDHPDNEDDSIFTGQPANS
jgi:hypothetical protein